MSYINLISGITSEGRAALANSRMVASNDVFGINDRNALCRFAGIAEGSPDYELTPALKAMGIQLYIPGRHFPSSGREVPARGVEVAL